MASQWIARPDISLSETKGEEQLTVREDSTHARQSGRGMQPWGWRRSDGHGSVPGR